MTRLESMVSRRRRKAGTKIGPCALALRFLSDTRGATVVEYGLIAGLTFLAVVGALHTYADRMTAMYQYIGNSITKSS
ncbi:Flp family type IVb pilin [Methylobacterium sp.]|jgi:Flp pilus assembly pilin Flp|uniref:Flp family type IVb pilin n=1 Tax=Methylobacterium sp. TaxID=409 RepID=UPI0034585C34|nr:Flp family type IVb pilin [Methylobacterium sp.]